MKRLFLCALTAGFLLASAHAGNLQISLINPTLVVTTDSSMNWLAGLSDPVDVGAGNFILILGSSFDVPNPGCCGGPPAADGFYTDLVGSLSQLIVLGPAGNCCGDPSSIANQAIGSFTGPASDIPTQTVTGFLEIDYLVSTVDPNSPNFDPTIDVIDPGGQAFAAATLDVLTPEPSTFWLMLLAVCAGVAWRLVWRTLHSSAGSAA